MLHCGKNLRVGRPFVIYIYKKRLIVLIERRTKDARLLSKERNRTEDAMSLEHAMGVMKTLLCFFCAPLRQLSCLSNRAFFFCSGIICYLIWRG